MQNYIENLEKVYHKAHFAIQIQHENSLMTCSQADKSVIHMIQLVLVSK